MSNDKVNRRHAITLSLRLIPEQRDRLRKAAAALDVTESDFIREAVLVKISETEDGIRVNKRRSEEARAAKFRPPKPLEMDFRKPTAAAALESVFSRPAQDQVSVTVEEPPKQPTIVINNAPAKGERDEVAYLAQWVASSSNSVERLERERLVMSVVQSVGDPEAQEKLANALDEKVKVLDAKKPTPVGWLDRFLGKK